MRKKEKKLRKRGDDSQSKRQSYKSNLFFKKTQFGLEFVDGA